MNLPYFAVAEAGDFASQVVVGLAFQNVAAAVDSAFPVVAGLAFRVAVAEPSPSFEVVAPCLPFAVEAGVAAGLLLGVPRAAD